MRRIGFLVDSKLFRRDNHLFADTPFFHFLLAFRDYCDEVVMMSRVFDLVDPAEAPYAIPDDRVRVVPLPAYPRIFNLFTHPLRYWPRINTVLRTTLPDLDALWLNYGHPVSLRALLLADQQENLRCFAVVRGTYDRDARLRTGGPSLVGAVASQVMRTSMAWFGNLARRRQLPCFAFGDEMYHRLQKTGLDVRLTCSSLLTDEDIAAPPPPRPSIATDLLVVGRLTPEKGIDVLLDALVDLERPDGSAVTLRIVGSGPEEDRLKAQTKHLGLEQRVFFDGHVPFGPELFARYASTRLVVIPSRTEGIPKAATEAMAFGRPVIATAVGGLPEVVGSQGERGRLVPREDRDALRATLRDVISSEETIQQMGLHARAYGREITREGQVRAIVQRVAPDWLGKGQTTCPQSPSADVTDSDIDALDNDTALS
jgi:glycosyltransferase involved in cell wall biosynthesis